MIIIVTIFMVLTLLVGIMIGHIIASKQKEEVVVTNSLAITKEDERVKLIPKYKELSFYKAKYLISAKGAEIPLLSTGMAGVHIMCHFDEKHSDVIWINDSSGKSTEWEFDWGSVMEVFPEYAHEIRLLGNSEYERKYLQREQIKMDLKEAGFTDEFVNLRSV